MKYKELQLNKIYTNSKRYYYLIIDKNLKDFHYYKYNYINKKWYNGYETINNFKNPEYIWSKLELTEIYQQIKYEMIKNLFKYGLKDE